MRDEARAEELRARRKALFERFASGEGAAPAAPGEPELSGLGYYRVQPLDEQPAPEAAAEPVAADEPAKIFAEHQEPVQPEEFVQEPVGQDEAQPETRYIPQLDEHPVDSADEYFEADDAQAHEFEEHDPFIEADPEAEATKKQRRKRTKRKRNLIMVALVLVFALVVAGSVLTVKSVLKRFNPDDYPGPGGATVEFTVQDGWGVSLISRKLEEQDIISNDKLFGPAVEDLDSASKLIHPGTYLLKKQMPVAEAAKELVDNRPDKVFYFALKANLRMPAALKEIADGSGLKLETLTTLANQPKKFGLPAEVKNLEGWLHPGEYRFDLESSAEEVLQELVDATKNSLKDAGESNLAKGYRALKIASIMQAEATPNDYATVAGAIENRLHPSNTETHGLLQVDSAVIYGLDRYTLQFSQAERQDKSNAYNTYVHPGLTPTPIGSPNDAAIKAAVNPKSNSYYYWVTVNTNTGETKFASTYAEHQRNQAEFRSWCEQNSDVCK